MRTLSSGKRLGEERLVPSTKGIAGISPSLSRYLLSPSPHVHSLNPCSQTLRVIVDALMKFLSHIDRTITDNRCFHGLRREEARSLPRVQSRASHNGHVPTPHARESHRIYP